MSKPKKTQPKKTAKTAREPKAKRPSAGRTSALDAAVRVLTASKAPMNCAQMIEAMLKGGFWKTGGKTPAATLSSAIQREIKNKGKDSRFKKVERGQFALA